MLPGKLLEGNLPLLLLLLLPLLLVIGGKQGQLLVCLTWTCTTGLLDSEINLTISKIYLNTFDLSLVIIIIKKYARSNSVQL